MRCLEASSIALGSMKRSSPVACSLMIFVLPLASPSGPSTAYGTIGWAMPLSLTGSSGCA